ncbi:conserved hypothetical protein (plasmid) [Borreliella garinii PBr]|uniref:Uncharacterized protein n=1 Tax=Borreliella garinii PBr TaxID=498743 RepID=B8F133_BORGR|nr:conserved hypothetical protein [Borreliella garinii PBr]
MISKIQILDLLNLQLLLLFKVKQFTLLKPNLYKRCLLCGICCVNAYRKLTKNNENNSKNVDLLDQLFSSRATYIKRKAIIAYLNIKSKVNIINCLFIMNYAKLDPLFSR